MRAVAVRHDQLALLAVPIVVDHRAARQPPVEESASVARDLRRELVELWCTGQVANVRPVRPTAADIPVSLLAAGTVKDPTEVGYFLRQHLHGILVARRCRHRPALSRGHSEAG